MLVERAEERAKTTDVNHPVEDDVRRPPVFLVLLDYLHKFDLLATGQP
jgi:hypothetical protein